MAFRTIIIKNRCKLEYSLNYLVCRNETETRILLDEISSLIIHSTEVSITTALLSALMDRNIRVVFCDGKHNPQSQLLPIYGTNDSYKKICIQTGWNTALKDKLWKDLIIRKITNQANNLKKINEDAYEKLMNYSKEVHIGDTTNREGHAAKVYFNALFGNDFSRNKDCPINKYLDYGYSIILSSINREIKCYGYLTEIGIHHIGETNPFNLSCDLIEPIRPYVDSYVINGKLDDDNFKKELSYMLNNKVKFKNQEMYLENAIKLYVQNILNVLKNEKGSIEFIDYEL